MRMNKGFGTASNAKYRERCFICGTDDQREKMRKEVVEGKPRWVHKVHKKKVIQ